MPKIQYIKGNLFDTDIRHIAHGCNAQGVMGSGVAAIIRDRYNLAYLKYVARHKQSPWQLGDVQGVDVGDKVILNAITQNLYGRSGKRYVSYDAVAECMHTINDMYYDLTDNRIAMPQIGAGLGGGDWNVIASIVESECTYVQPVVYIL